MNAAKLFTFDRWDFLSTKVLIVLAGLLVPIFTLLVPAAMWAQNKPLEWAGPTGQDEKARSAEAIAKSGTEAHWADQAVVKITDASTEVWMASLLPGAVLTLVTLSICWFLYRLITGIQREKEFTSASVWALRGIALSLLIGAAAYTVVTGIADDIVMNSAVNGPETALITISIVGPILISVVALIIAAIAEAFAHGAKIQDDVEGLV